MECYNPITIYKNLNATLYPYGIKVPCGKCHHCIANRKTEKAIRMVHEKQTFGGKAYFLTFTYDEKNVHKTINGELTLSKEFCRKNRDKIYSKLYRMYLKSNKTKEYHKHYKYMIKGEYGGKGTERPHYHIILLINKYNSKILHTWQKYFKGGRMTIEEARSNKAIFYAAGYTAKKLGKEEDKSKPEQEFLFCSRGLGKDWAIKNAEMLKGRHYIYIPKKNGVAKHKIFNIYITWMKKAGIWNAEDEENYREEKRLEVERRDKQIFDEIDLKQRFITGKPLDKQELVFKRDSGVVWMNRNGKGVKEYINSQTVIEIDQYGGEFFKWTNTILEDYKYNYYKKMKHNAEKKAKEWEQKKKSKYINWQTNKGIKI